MDNDPGLVLTKIQFAESTKRKERERDRERERERERKRERDRERERERERMGDKWRSSGELHKGEKK